MSTTAKAVWGVVFVLAIVAGWYYWSSTSATPTDTNGSVMNSGQTSASDTSDAALLKDSAQIDAQMSGLDADNAAAAQTDQPVSQTY